MKQETLREEMAHSFEGRQRWIVQLVWVYLFVWFGLAVWAAVRFFDTPKIVSRDSILYATLFVLAFLTAVQMKMWYWSRLDRNAILRAIERVERKSG